MSFPRYPEYKDSGVEWLGEVPAHWEVRRLRHAVQLNPSKSEVRHLPGKTEVSFLPMEAIGDDGSLDRERSRPISEVESGYTYFRDGDVTIAKITPCFENGKGAVMRDLLGGIGFGTTELIVARPDDAVVSSEYLDRIFNSHPFRRLGEAAMYGAGGQKRVPDDFVRDFAIALPPREEQADIETFLDRETAKIDALVAEQERLIALLKEKRQAVISHAVTKGLDPSVPMMDSGVEWLGKVPAHWLIRPIKHVGRLKGGAGFPHSEQGVEGEELCFYKVGSLGQSSSTGYLNESENTISRETASALGAFIFPKETLVFAKVGAALFLARVRALPADACLDNNMMGLVVDETKHAPAFVRYAMTLVRFDLIANPGAVPSLNEGQIGNFALAFPPSKAEQEAIAAFLDRATGQLEDLFAQAETVISTLRERRTALISAAVTGQIDVRGAPEQAP